MQRIKAKSRRLQNCYFAFIANTSKSTRNINPTECLILHENFRETAAIHNAPAVVVTRGAGSPRSRWIHTDSSKSPWRPRCIYLPVPLLSDSRTATRSTLRQECEEGLRSLVRSEPARTVLKKRSEKREERTGWRINQRGSCKSRVEARDTSLALSCSKSATAAIEIDLTLPYDRHRPYHRGIMALIRVVDTSGIPRNHLPPG